MGEAELWNLGMKSIRSLEADRGILASGRDEAYGCIFGRDSLITALKLLGASKYESAEYFLPLVKKIIRNLADLQGTAINIESGEEPGKIIHEYRPDRHEHLTAALENPWYVYPDGTMRNYDSVDSTPLYLMTLHKYIEASKDQDFLNEMLPSAVSALKWLLQSSNEPFINYSFLPERTYGGLRTQSWMDSTESLFYERRRARAVKRRQPLHRRAEELETTAVVCEKSNPVGKEEIPPYPISPLEAQAYAWAALCMWSARFKESDPAFSNAIRERARVLKREFNEKFVLKGARSVTLAYAIDGTGRRLSSVRSSMGHVLWAAYEGESILDHRFIPYIARRLLARDLFVPGAGIRTLSNRSSRYDPHSYHNGSIWPHDTAIAAQGLENFGYTAEARVVREALIKSYQHFQTPIELFAYHRRLREYAPASGHRACRTQAWSAAGLLSTLAAQGKPVF
jgi:glycogen debranching enzyme